MKSTITRKETDRKAGKNQQKDHKNPKQKKVFYKSKDEKTKTKTTAICDKEHQQGTKHILESTFCGEDTLPAPFASLS